MIKRAEILGVDSLNLTLLGVVLLILAFEQLDERRMVLLMLMTGIFAFMYAFRRGVRLKAAQLAAKAEEQDEEASQA
ncbi:MAG: hypothetical protein AAFR59_15740 [Bacteroidota bacterium]